MAASSRTPLLVALVLLGLVLPFLGKPVHIDDANFLVLARGAALDPWRPHAIAINWQGTTQPAFEVLSNPPGIGWWLAPVVDAPVWVQHLWMLPWLLLAAAGAWRLGDHFAGRPAAATLLLCGAPAAVLAAQALTPDLPLFACTLAGLGGIVASRRPLAARWPWALVLGCAALFRYSGAALLPLAAAWPLLSRGRKGLRSAVVLGAAAALPILLLGLHDVLAYGEPHVVAMTRFQGVADAPRDVARKLVATLCMLGGALVLPVLCWSRPVPALIGAVLGCVVGGMGASMSGQTGIAALGTLAFGASGGAVLGALVPGAPGEGNWREPDPARRLDRSAAFLLLWLVGGLVFLLKLRFTAARYLLPFFAPAVLLGLRMAHPRAVRVAIPLTLVLAGLLAADDLGLARAQLDLARRADAVAAQQGPGVFAGHWGWQHHLEARGWTALEEDAPVPAGALFARSVASWPQAAADDSCLVPVDAFEAPGPWYLPRVHSWTHAANIHASVVSAEPPIETYSPWTLATDPYDRVTVQRGCRTAP
ncbi:MAG: hypothetical protein H6742_14490 [Alphaproteobacteria bacterium]|nr:hypothetical protein [Alphaproteobacteria bacterium]